MWNKNQFEKAADEIGQSFVSSQGKSSINDLATKVAADNQLNLEGIRTMVRLANVSAFEKLFSKAGADKAPDRMLEFEVGDPEIVINRLHKNAEEKHAVKQASTYNRVVDYHSDVAREIVPLEKCASAIPGFTMPEAKPPVGYSKQMVQTQFKLAGEKLREEGLQARARWTDAMEKAAQCTRTLPGGYAEVEKLAMASFGEQVLPELCALQKSLAPKSTFDGHMKIAHVLATHVAVITKEQVPALKLLKEATEARTLYLGCKKSCQWVAENLPK